jgi:hypothetical protein
MKVSVHEQENQEETETTTAKNSLANHRTGSGRGDSRISVFEAG